MPFNSTRLGVWIKAASAMVMPPEMDCATSRITLHSDDSEQQTTLTPVAERPNSIIIHSRCERSNSVWKSCSLPGVELRSDEFNRIREEAGRHRVLTPVERAYLLGM